MAKPNETYSPLIVESYRAKNTSGLHGDIHIRPVAGQGVDTNLRVECSRELKSYPVGTRFKVHAKLTDRKESGEFFYVHYKSKFEIMK